MGDAGNSNAGAKLTLYTNHRCPWAHRAHVALKELDLVFDEVIIDLDTPREPWYLKINPRGLVPALKYEHPDLAEPLIVLESGLVVNFLIDAYPDTSAKISPPPTSPQTAKSRYRVAFFVDTFFGKVAPITWKMMGAKDRSALEEAADSYVNAVQEHIEPLLSDADPFFGGSKNMTLAEIQTASFILRLYDFSNDDLQPTSLVQRLDQLPNFSNWARNLMNQHSVNYFWDKDDMIEQTTARREKIQAKIAALK